MSDYRGFITSKTDHARFEGFDVDPSGLHADLFDFQRHLVQWSLRLGRSAIFADCGLGKTIMQLEWANRVAERTSKPVLILTPLAVASQTVSEAEKFGIEAFRSDDGLALSPITVTNYERIEHFDPDDFSGVVCDESSILKNFNGTRRRQITRFCKGLRYRLLCTATAAPNDYTELGTSSEALGNLGHMDMLSKFFRNEQGNTGTRRFHGKAPKWRFKKHAEDPFWRWVCSWARMLRKPSDVGGSDDGFDLPKLTHSEHVVKAKCLPDGHLFEKLAVGLKEEREERKRTLEERCEKAAELSSAIDGPSLLWAHTNAEADLLEQLIDGAVQVKGSDSVEDKESRLLGFARGEIDRLVTKPKIGAWGLNFQRCAHMVMFPSHSFEQYYQSVRRCWRFGQKSPVHVDIVTTEGELSVLGNLRRKAEQADRMFDSLVSNVGNALKVTGVVEFKTKEEVPEWLL